jgi:hypothetical protein
MVMNTRKERKYLTLVVSSCRRGIGTDCDKLVALFTGAVKSCFSNTKLDSLLFAWHSERCRK